MMLPASNTFTYVPDIRISEKELMDRMKVLLYEGDGWLLCYKRFTDGKLQWPRSEKEARDLTPQQYRWLMEGLSIDQPKAIQPAKDRDY